VSEIVNLDRRTAAVAAVNARTASDVQGGGEAGAAQAIVSRGGSLLPVGITEIQGKFGEGAAVEVLDPGGSLVGKGLVTLSSAALGPLLGRHSSTVTVDGWGGEVIHRDDLVVLVDSEDSPG